MEITDVTVHPLAVPESDAKADATQATAVVEVETDEGITGIGEASTSPWVARALIEAPSVHTKVAGLKHVIEGRDPFDAEALWDEMFYRTYGLGRKGAAINAISSIDIALWDIMGKATGKPVHKLLGGRYRDSVRAYASTLFPPDPDDTEYMRETTREVRDAGFGAVKFGWGAFGEDTEADDRLVGAAREAGPGIDLMVDAGLAFRNDVKRAVREVNALDAAHDLFWVEEPVYADNYGGYARIAEATETRIVGGESEYTADGFRHLLDCGRVDGVQPDVARSGGITHLRKVADLARSRGVPLYPHGFSTDIVVAASLQVVAATENAPLLEYCIDGGPLRWDLVNEEFPVEGGAVSIPDEPGLGISLDRSVVDEYRVEL